MKRISLGTLVLLLAAVAVSAQQPSSRVIPFNNVAATIAPGTTGQALTLQLWDDPTAGTLQFSETQTLDVDSNGAISFKLGAATSGGLDPNNFPSGSSRFLDVVDSGGASVLTGGRIALNATPFALSPGPQGPPGLKGDSGPPGPPGVVQAVTASDSSISIGGSVANPTVAVAANGITNAQVANGALSPAKIAGTAATLGANLFSATQMVVSGSDIFIGNIPTPSLAGSSNLFVENTGGDPKNSFRLDGSVDTFYMIAHSAFGATKGAGIRFRTSPAGVGFGEFDRMTITPDGNVGIGTTSSQARLDVVGNGADVLIGDPGCGAGSQTVAIGFVTNAGLNCQDNFNFGASTLNKETVINRPTGGRISFREGNGPDQMTIGPAGQVTINGNSAATGPALAVTTQGFQPSALSLQSSSGFLIRAFGPTRNEVFNLDAGGSLLLSGQGPGPTLRSFSDDGLGLITGTNTGPNIALFQTSLANRARIDSTGKVFANGGFQTGGADFAESLEPLGQKDTYQPGDVLVIDPSRSRAVALAVEAYSTRVAGIYSTKPGLLATPYTMDDPRLAKEIPMAVMGIVPCKVSAENGPIERGDLLVTSSTPGHAMKGTDRGRMLGAVVGKALEPLSAGKGVIQVLVTLQ